MFFIAASNAALSLPTRVKTGVDQLSVTLVTDSKSDIVTLPAPGL